MERERRSKKGLPSASLFFGRVGKKNWRLVQGVE
jgi:hypothetical protein